MKSDYIQLRITPQLKAVAIARAADLGLELSEYLRNLILMDTSDYEIPKLSPESPSAYSLTKKGLPS